MLTDFPSLLDAEIVENELGGLECPVSAVVRDVDSCVAESDDVSSSVTGKVGDETRVLVDLPSLSGPEVVDHQVDRTKSTASRVQRGVYSSTATPNNVDLSVAGQVSDEAGVLIDAPATRAVAEVVDDGLGGCEGSVPIVAADEDVALAESYDIHTAVAYDVAHEAEVAIEAPTPSVVAEIGERNVGGIEFCVAVVLGDENSAIPKSNNVASSDASNVS